MRKIVAIKVGLYFDPFDTRWSNMSDFEHWLAKHLAINGMEADRIEVIGNPTELMLVIKSKPEIPNEPKLHKAKPIDQQIKNLKVK